MSVGGLPHLSAKTLCCYDHKILEKEEYMFMSGCLTLHREWERLAVLIFVT